MLSIGEPKTILCDHDSILFLSNPSTINSNNTLSLESNLSDINILSGGNIKSPTLTSSKVVQTNISNDLIATNINLATQTTGSINITTQTNNILPATNGGTGNNTIGINGNVAYSDGSDIQYTTIGTTGQILSYNASAAPTFISAGSTINSVNAGTGINITGVPTVNPTINLTTPVIITNGGTQTSSIGAAGSIIYSDGTKYNTTLVGTSGYFLESQGAAAPVFTNITSLISGVQKLYQNLNSITINNPTSFITMFGPGSKTTALNDLSNNGSTILIKIFGTITTVVGTTVNMRVSLTNSFATNIFNVISFTNTGTNPFRFEHSFDTASSLILASAGTMKVGTTNITPSFSNGFNDLTFATTVDADIQCSTNNIANVIVINNSYIYISK